MTSKSKACNLKLNQKAFYLQSNQVASCCRAQVEEIDNNRNIEYYLDHWKQESQQLSEGIELDGCRHCWQAEKQGKLSDRQLSTQVDNVVELYISNLCNHMCSYCNPNYSSVWEQSINSDGMFQNISLTSRHNLKKLTSLTNINHWIAQIENYIHTCDDNSVLLKLLGGEPLMQQRNLEKLLSFNSEKIKTLLIHTNLNPPTNKFLIWLLDNIDINKLKIKVSLDATPDFNHIPRAGFNQELFIANLNLLQSKNINFEFHSVLSVLGIFDLDKFIIWSNFNNFKVKYNKLYSPDCLAPQYVPRSFRQQIWNKINHLELNPIVVEILQQPDNIVDIKLFEQYNYLTQYFTRTNIDPMRVDNELFVEYWSWLTNCYKK